MITVKEADFFLWGGASHIYIYTLLYTHIHIYSNIRGVLFWETELRPKKQEYVAITWRHIAM